jgi:hypothetical protein
MSVKFDGKTFVHLLPVTARAVCFQNVHINVQNVLISKVCENVFYQSEYIKLCNERKKLRIQSM